MSVFRPLFLSWLLAAGLVPGHSHAAIVACARLAAQRIPDVSIASAAEVRGEVKVGAGDAMKPTSLTAPICRVAGVARPTTKSQIRFELWIPAGGAWNGKYLQLGNGGFAGQIPYRDFGRYVRRGYAVAATDDGHSSADVTDASWARNAPEKIQDFAYRAVQSTHDAARSILRAHTGRDPALSYFIGCSNGGREALQSAQRLPEAFNGIVAGDPAIYMTSLLGSMGLLARDFAGMSGGLPAAKLPTIQKGALAVCGAGRGFVSDPLSCHFDPGVLACDVAKPGLSGDRCLTPQELKATRRIYAGSRELSSGELLGGPLAGAEAEAGSWLGWILGFGTDLRDRAGIEQFSRNFYAYFVRSDPAFRIEDLNIHDVENGHARYATWLDADDTDLHRFAAHGGKLIQYHGANDPGIPPGYSVHYFNNVQRRLGDTADFYRLFLVPGMLHCGGGAAPFEVDWLAELEAWVERGVAPDRLRARWPAEARIPAGAPPEQTLVRFRR